MAVNKVESSQISKYVVNSLSIPCASVDDSWIIVDLLDISQGVTESTRTGNKIYVDQVDLHLTIAGGQSNSVVDDVYNTVRVMVVVASESLVSADWTLSLNQPSLRNVFPKVRRILYDKFVTLSSYSMNSVGLMTRTTRLDKKIKVKRPFMFEAADGTHTSDSLYFAIMSDSSAVTNPGLVGPSAAWVYFSNTGV